MEALYLAAGHRSSGKTTVALGLSAALAERGLAVQPYKKGPDYIDPMWHTRAAGRGCRNLDFTTQGREEIRAEFGRHLAGADLGLVEGNTGLFDGTALDGSNSNAAMAKLLGLPVVLVVDTRGMNRGIAPLLLGYQAFDPDLDLAGVIFNQVANGRHESKLREVVEHYTDLQVLGALRRDPSLGIDERHLGLVPSNEAQEVTDHLGRLARAVAEQVDLEAVRDLARPPATPVGSGRTGGRADPDVRIGIARDAAFSFYYPDDLEALEAGGAELVPIDTLSDPHLPEVDGLFLGGGFPEVQMEGLAANASLRADIRAACESGLPVYAECGGLMYLARRLRWGDREAEMVGFLPGDAVMAERPQGKGYVLLRDRGTGPWPGEAGNGGVVHAHEFHYSRLDNLEPGQEFAFQVLRGTGIDGEHDGLVRKNVLACYTHLRHVASDPWTERFLACVRARKHSEAPAPALACPHG